MDKELIENAALLFAGAGEFGELPYNPDAKNGFMAGVQWRINSVWHDNSIRPGEDCDVLVETKRGIEMDRYDIDYNELDNGTDWEADVIRWAYVDDLLPEKKGGAQ